MLLMRNRSFLLIVHTSMRKCIKKINRKRNIYFGVALRLQGYNTYTNNKNNVLNISWYVYTHTNIYYCIYTLTFTKHKCRLYNWSVSRKVIWLMPVRMFNLVTGSANCTFQQRRNSSDWIVLWPIAFLWGYCTRSSWTFAINAKITPTLLLDVVTENC